MKDGINAIKKEVGDTDFAYLHGNKWITKEKRDQIAKDIENELKKKNK